MTEDGNPVRAAAYQRISEVAWAGDEHGVANQLADQERTAAARGYEIVLVKSDNDISALTGRHRPGYQAVMAAAARREIDVILVYQTSRFWRNRRERAEGIEILRTAGVSIIATKGPSLDMSTAYGRAMAGLLGEFDTLESEVKGERQQLANEADAKAGKARKGSPLPFGWQADRITRNPDEAAAVLDACRALLAGGTVSGIMRDWDERGLRPHQAPFGPLPEHAWTRTSVREILANPRNAGIAVYRKEKDDAGIACYNEVGRGEWEPLVTEEMYRAVAEILREQKQRPTQGVTSMLGGIALCRCGNRVTGSANASGSPAYRCDLKSRHGRAGPHVQVKRAEVDAAVGRLVVAALSAPDAAAVLAPEQDDADTAALRDEAAILRHKIARLGELYIEDKITEADLVGGRERGRARLAEIEARLAEAGRGSALAPLVGAADPAAAWEALSTDRRRAVVDALMTVVLHPSGRGARVFREDVVLPPGRGIIWKN